MEIEKKFTVDPKFKIPKGLEYEEIIQKYLHLDKNSEMRIRITGSYTADDEEKEVISTVTIKKGRGEIREESELRISSSLFDSLWDVNSLQAIHKTRYLIPFNGKTVELDVFPFNDELPIIAEIEFESKEEMETFEFPDWFQEEVKFKNRDLFMHLNNKLNKNLKDLLYDIKKIV